MNDPSALLWVYQVMSCLRMCDACNGFAVPGAGHCPHCAHKMGGGRPVLTAAMGVAASMTLMACYGSPDDYYGPGPEDDTVGEDTGEDGGDWGPQYDLPDAESCSPSTPIVPLEVYDVTFVDSTDQGSADNEGSCGGEGRERVYGFEAPADWQFRATVEVNDPSADPVLYVRDMGVCGHELVCSDLLGQTESVIFWGTGETVYIVVDFAEPDLDPNTIHEFTLNLEAL